MTERCAICGCGPSVKAQIRTCYFDITHEFKTDYPLCAVCRKNVAETIRSIFQTIFRSTPAKFRKNILL